VNRITEKFTNAQWVKISLPKRLITTSITDCFQVPESVYTIKKHFWKVSSLSSTKSTSTHLLSSCFLAKILYGFSALPSLLYAPLITPSLITLIIFYKPKNYEAPHVNFHVLMLLYPSADQMISSGFSSQTPSANIHCFKLRLMS
jgi:hypothetical protein